MLFLTMFLSLSMYFIGFLGFILNRRHVILALLSIELMLLAVTVIALTSCSATGTSYGSLDLMGFAIGLYIIVIAGAESAIGLALVVSYHRNHGQIYLD